MGMMIDAKVAPVGGGSTFNSRRSSVQVSLLNVMSFGLGVSPISDAWSITRFTALTDVFFFFFQNPKEKILKRKFMPVYSSSWLSDRA